jgi:DNA-binding IscR family transcriptional regulator
MGRQFREWRCSPARVSVAIAAVIDVARSIVGPGPVSAKVLAERHALPARHLEPVLQALVRVGY